MRMVDLITKKKEGAALTEAEIRYFIDGVTNGDIPDYQTSALLMAICFRGMDAEETAQLTMAMMRSGDVVNLDAIDGVKMDKHSTGGVGDKTTLIVAPIVASLGVRVAKMSGRGLGHTGGTIDKLESIPGLRTLLTKDEMVHITRMAGLCVAGQTGNLAPADKKLYALRDVTATVDSIPLIAASIMSKKLAAGAGKILLDVKIGSGAFMRTIAEAEALAAAMVHIGKAAGRETVAVITEMGVPLGKAIGNALEVIEAVDTLRGDGPTDLTTVCKQLSREMLMLSGLYGAAECEALIDEAIASGAALSRLAEMVALQGGDGDYIMNTDKFRKAECALDVPAPQGGFVHAMDTAACGAASCLLGAGREKLTDGIDHAAGIILHAKTGDAVRAGEPLATLYAADMSRCHAAAHKLSAAYAIQPAPPEPTTLIHKRITYLDEWEMGLHGKDGIHV